MATVTKSMGAVCRAFDGSKLLQYPKLMWLRIAFKDLPNATHSEHKQWCLESHHASHSSHRASGDVLLEDGMQAKLEKHDLLDKCDICVAQR